MPPLTLLDKFYEEFLKEVIGFASSERGARP